MRMIVPSRLMLVSSMRLLLCLLGLLVLNAAAAEAQSTSTVTPNTPTGQPQPGSERDTTFGTPGGGLNMMDLIHQANMGSVRNMDQYKRDRDRGLDDAINNFRRTDVRITPKIISPAPAGETVPSEKP
ncbi:glr3666 [Gloeobacter violaceus PCC 7421]|uniref:Glr3666 protein n=2 Tax=Gloeobacter violaceus TaxID=33072 RepID=Q7NF60_GLOVI|nr:glr3666 [Gloeobacter violaceus PCC 7421]